MSKITRDLLKYLRGDIEDALRSVGEKHGIKFSTGNASFTANNATMKLEIASINDNGEVVTKEASDFKVYCGRFGLNPNHLGQTFNAWNGEEYTIVGCKPRSHKYPIVVENPNGKRFKFTAHDTLQGLGEKNTINESEEDFENRYADAMRKEIDND